MTPTPSEEEIKRKERFKEAHKAIALSKGLRDVYSIHRDGHELMRAKPLTNWDDYTLVQAEPVSWGDWFMEQVREAAMMIRRVSPPSLLGSTSTEHEAPDNHPTATPLDTKYAAKEKESTIQ